MIEISASHPVSPNRTYHIEVDPGKSIRIHGDDNGTGPQPTPFDLTFKIGEVAIYNSFNMTYTGEIVSIGNKTVSIAHPGYRKKTTRLSFLDFAWRNGNFNLERIQKENLEESYSI